MRANSGAVPSVRHRPVAGPPTTVTRSRARTGPWYVACSCAGDPTPVHPSSAVVGVAGGRAACAPLSHTDTIDHPRGYRRDQADVPRVQQRNAAATPAENGPEHANQQGMRAKRHARLANRRRDGAHQQRRTLGKREHVLVVAARAPHALGTRSGMRKRIVDGAWSPFIGMAVSNAADAGRRVMRGDPTHPSTLCSGGGPLVEQPLRDRVHACAAWGLVRDRDVHAAITSVQRGRQSLQTCYGWRGAARP